MLNEKNKKMKIHQDPNPKHWPYYVLIGITIGNKVVDNQYEGFSSISEAKQFVKDNPNLIYL